MENLTLQLQFASEPSSRFFAQMAKVKLMTTYTPIYGHTLAKIVLIFQLKSHLENQQDGCRLNQL